VTGHCGARKLQAALLRQPQAAVATYRVNTSPASLEGGPFLGEERSGAIKEAGCLLDSVATCWRDLHRREAEGLA
jgi:hypothetical protein